MTDLSITDLVERLQRLERKHFGNSGPKAVTGAAAGGIDITENGTTVVEQASAIEVGANASAVDNGDGSATVDTTDTDTNTHADITQAGATVAADVSAIDIGTNVDATDNGDGTVTLTSTDTDTQARQQVCQIQSPDGYDINTGSGTRLNISSVPITAAAFTVDTTNDVITLEEDGTYEINCSYRGRHTGSYTDRINPRIYARHGNSNAIPGALAAGGYVRNANNHDESSLAFSAVIEVTAPHDIYFEHSTGNGTSGYDWSIWKQWSAITVKKLTA